MAKAIQIQQHGGPDEMRVVDVAVGDPGPGEIRVRHHACGVNFIDVYQRDGHYPFAMPLTLGMEGAGVVEAVGPALPGEPPLPLQPGDRVAYASQPPGAYSEARVMPGKCVVKLPDAIDFETAAAMMLKGMTVQYLLRRTLPQGGLQGGDFVVFHAAAGGVGLIACQWAKAIGLRLIGTAGSNEKCRLALAHGAEFMVNYAKDDFVARVKEITGGRGVKVVYDTVGKDTFDKSLDCLRPLGLAVAFGASSGPVPPINVSTLAAKGSLYVTRPTIFTHMATRESTQAMADDLFAMVTAGHVKIETGARHALADAAQAHRDLEARRTTGSLLLIP